METDQYIPPKAKRFRIYRGIKVLLGDFTTDKARQLAQLVKKYANNEIRFTLRQNILIRDVQEIAIPFFYQELKRIGLADFGYNTFGDITACPGTDTCNLGIASSTGIARELEKVIFSEFPQYLKNKDLTIKISGCMNACGQHNMAHIGFQGMSMKVGKTVFPALQVLLGGGTLGNGRGRFADKVIKIPSKRGPEALRILIKDFEALSEDGESFLDYYDRKGQIYFYDILKIITETETLTEEDQVDWGNEDAYKVAVGVGECAGVVIDLVATLLLEAREKLELSEEAFNEKRWSDSIYHTYAGLVNAAKAILLSENKSTNSYANIIALFDETFTATGKIDLEKTFAEITYQIQSNEPSKAFAHQYFKDAVKVFEAISNYREKEVTV
jgi:sulfite reductase (ferredoxin)